MFRGSDLPTERSIVALLGLAVVGLIAIIVGAAFGIHWLATHLRYAP